jgi:hypothetical protein
MEHNRKHSHQGLSIAINSFSNMLGVILQQNNDATLTSVSLESIGIWRYPIKSCSSFVYSTIFSNRIQANTWGARVSLVQTKIVTKILGGYERLTLELLACCLDNLSHVKITFFELNNFGHQDRHLILLRRHILWQFGWFLGLFHCSPSLVFLGWQPTLEIHNPGKVLNTMIRRFRFGGNPRNLWTGCIYWR